MAAGFTLQLWRRQRACRSAVLPIQCDLPRRCASSPSARARRARRSRTLHSSVGGTLSFASAPVVNGVATAAIEYVHFCKGSVDRGTDVRRMLFKGILTTFSPWGSLNHSPSCLMTSRSWSALCNSCIHWQLPSSRGWARRVSHDPTEVTLSPYSPRLTTSSCWDPVPGRLLRVCFARV
jgi:hypothetical protein